MTDENNDKNSCTLTLHYAGDRINNFRIQGRSFEDLVHMLRAADTKEPWIKIGDDPAQFINMNLVESYELRPGMYTA